MSKKGIKTYDIELDQVRKEKFTEEFISAFEAISGSLEKIQVIVNDIDTRICSIVDTQAQIQTANEAKHTAIDATLADYEARIFALENP